MKIHVCCLFVSLFLSTKQYLSHKFKCFPACTVEETVEYISHIFDSVLFLSFSLSLSLSVVELMLIFCLALLNHVLCVAVFFFIFVSFYSIRMVRGLQIIILYPGQKNALQAA